MATLKQLPEKLDIYLVKGDDYTFSIHSDIDLSSYEMEASCGDADFTITKITNFDYNISITKQQTNSFVHDKNWTLEWIDPNGQHRTVISGNIRVN